MDISKYGKERKERIANRLRHERETKVYTFDEGDRKGETLYGLTQDDLAEIIRSTRQTIGTWEKKGGKNKIPNPDTIITLCDLYDCDYGYLICEYDSRKHEIADIQEQTGLSEQAIDVLRKSKLIADFGQDLVDDCLEEMHRNGIISIDDLKRRKTQDTTTPELRLINTFIENCNAIASSLAMIGVFRKEHEFYNKYPKIEEVRNSFNHIYRKYSPSQYEQWLAFLDAVRPFFPENSPDDLIYEVWLGLIDEAEHGTENQHRYAINREFEKIIDKIIDKI